MMRFSPRYGAAAVGQWVGFSDLCALAEEALLRSFAEHGRRPGELASELGARLTVVDASLLITGRLRIDDEVTAQVRPLGSRYFDVRVAAALPGGDKDVVRGRLTAVVIAGQSGARLPDDLASLTVAGIAGMGTAVGSHNSSFEEQALAEAVAAGGPDGMHRSWRVPFSACRFGYMTHGGYLRALENLTEEFFAENDVPVGLTQARLGLVPAFTRARLRLVGEVRVDEVMHGVYYPAQVVQNKMIDGRADFYVYRDGTAVPTATAIFLHGFAPASEPTAIRGTELPDPLLTAVTRTLAATAGAEGR